jgi:uncharacterized protein YjbJ (UPF0337 family)
MRKGELFERRPMGIIDKITGRAKKAAGDLAGDESLHREGEREERKGQAKEELEREKERADDAAARADQKAREVADLERDTTPTDESRRH